MKELKFTNSDASPKIMAVKCDRKSVASIMAWYGAFYAGDRYTVHYGSEKLLKDHNGELVLIPRRKAAA